MRRMTALIGAALIALAIPMVHKGARAGDWVGLRDSDLRYDFLEPYGQRIDAVTQSAGNARDVNAVTHIIDPWPRGVMNRHIPGNGERMTVVIGRYRQDRLPALPPIQPVYPTSVTETNKPPQFELVTRPPAESAPPGLGGGGAR